MDHKKFLKALVAIALIVVAIYAGRATRVYTEARAPLSDKPVAGGITSSAKPFKPPAVPAPLAEEMRHQFSGFEIAATAKYLPDPGFIDLTGKTRHFSEFTGKPTLVNFWATWCPPCVEELPSLGAFAARYRGRLNVVGIALEQGAEPASIQTFLIKHDFGDFAGYLDRSGNLAAGLDLPGVPTTYLLNADGQIDYRFSGNTQWDGPVVQKFFDVYLLKSE